jgi:hypothetical protein
MVEYVFSNTDFGAVCKTFIFYKVILKLLSFLSAGCSAKSNLEIADLKSIKEIFICRKFDHVKSKFYMVNPKNKLDNEKLAV